MREIKFRGITFKGDFVYGDLSNDATGLSFNESQWLRNNITENRGKDGITAYWRETTKRIHWKEGSAFCNAPVKPETVGQLTGLLDKNGVEIYEGDIVHDSSDERCQVFWCDQTGQWQTSCDDSETCSIFETTETLAEVAPDSEVIGNIHGNPELIN